MGAKICLEDSPLGLVATFHGRIDEDFDFFDIKEAKNSSIILDLNHVEGINSVGIRNWQLWISKVDKDQKLTLRNCPASVVDQMNMILGFLPPNCVVESVQVPYYCSNCDQVALNLVSGLDRESVVEIIPCPRCGNESEIDIIPQQFFKFMKR